MYLLNTNIVSVLDPRRHATARDLVAWIRRNGACLWLSVITLMKLEAGILKLRRGGQNQRAERYEALRRAIEDDFGERILGIDRIVAIEAARLAEQARPTTPELADLLIAATAQAHGLTVLTRNLRHFEPTGVPALDPLTALPPDAVR